MVKKISTSWENVSRWYHDIVGEQGHYYHQTLIIPGVLKLLNFAENEAASVLDLACGQGILSRYLPESVSYIGIDASASLIATAKRLASRPSHQFIQADLTRPLILPEAPFSHGTLILALQNTKDPQSLLKHASTYLQPQARFVIVLNHPCFRIPRQSSWGIDDNQKIQYRRIDRYMSPMQIPIQTHPGKGKDSPSTKSFHYPLSAYSYQLYEAGFSIELIEEWCSNKISGGGPTAKMENRSRQEIPLFMTILACKK
jgi:ubiquinone/menaquinone biosynthesis C-methylase UbiE